MSATFFIQRARLETYLPTPCCTHQNITSMFSLSPISPRPRRMHRWQTGVVVSELLLPRMSSQTRPRRCNATDVENIRITFTRLTPVLNMGHCSHGLALEPHFGLVSQRAGALCVLAVCRVWLDVRVLELQDDLVHLKLFLAQLKDVPQRVQVLGHRQRVSRICSLNAVDRTTHCYTPLAFHGNYGLQVTRNILQFWVSSNPRLSPDWVDPRLVSECKALIDQSDKVNLEVNLEVCSVLEIRAIHSSINL